VGRVWPAVDLRSLLLSLSVEARPRLLPGVSGRRLPQKSTQHCKTGERYDTRYDNVKHALAKPEVLECRVVWGLRWGTIASTQNGELGILPTQNVRDLTFKSVHFSAF